MRALLVVLLAAPLVGCSGSSTAPACTATNLTAPSATKTLTNGSLTALTLTATLTAGGQPLAGDTVQIALTDGRPPDGTPGDDAPLWAYDGTTDGTGTITFDTQKGQPSQIAAAAGAKAFTATFQGDFAATGAAFCGSAVTGTIA